jgi:formylglycine-generating enzyme required for sulfatase activity
MDQFRECRDCPEMIVIRAGEFMMGSPPADKAADEGERERPQHEVIIAERFAVSRFEVTFDQWDECVAYGACNLRGAGGRVGARQAAGDQHKLG